MRSQLKQQFIACLLSVTLLLILGISFKTEKNNSTEASPSPFVKADLEAHIADFTRLTLLKPLMKNSFIVHSKRSAGESQSSESGGDVNGKHAKLSTVKQSAQVKTLSVTHVNQDIGRAPRKPTSTVKSDSGLTQAQIEEIFKGTSLEGYGLEKAILEIEEEYGINAYFTMAVMKLESAHGKSKIARNKNNLFGLNAIDGDEYNKAISFKTKGDSVRKFGQLISKNYVNKGYTTVEKISTKYCQANPKWSGLVMSIMEGDYRKL